MDVATLGLAVDSRPLADASDELERITEAAAKAERAAESFGVRTEAAGRKAAAANDNVAQSAQRAEKSFGLMTKAAAALGAVILASFSVGAIRDMVDTWSDLSARVGLAIGDMDGAAPVMDRLATVARRTYSSLQQTNESFIANSTALRELGYTTAQQLNYVEGLNLALVVSGARAERAAQVQNALSQAMALGQLRGQQLNTVIMNGGRVAELLAAELGVGVNQLRALGAEGEITGEVINRALSGNLEKLREEAELMPATIGDGFQLIQNAMLQLVGGFDQALGASETFAAGLIVVADNLDRIVTYAATAATGFGTYYVGAMVAAYVATITLTGALALLRTALIRLGITAIIVAAGELVYQFSRLVQAAGGFGDAMGLLGDVAAEVWDRIKAGGESLVLSLSAFFTRIQVAWLTALSVMQKGWADFLHSVAAEAREMSHIPGMTAIAQTIGNAAIMAGSAYYETEMAIEDATKAAQGFADASQEAADRASAPLESVARLREVMSGVTDETGAAGEAADRLNEALSRVGDGSAGSGASGNKGAGGKKGGAGERANEYERLTEQIRKNIDALMTEAQVVAMSTGEAARYTAEQDLLRAAMEANLPITDALREQIGQLAQEYANATLNMEGARLQMELMNDPLSMLQQEMQRLDEMLKAGAISWDVYGDAALRANMKAASSALGLAGDFSGAMSQIFADQKGFAIAAAIMNTAEAVTRTLSVYGATPWGLAAAAVAAAQGAAQIATIRSTQKGSGSVRSAGGSASVAQPRQQQSAPQQQAVTINLSGDYHPTAQVEEMIDALLKKQADGFQIVLSRG